MSFLHDILNALVVAGTATLVACIIGGAITLFYMIRRAPAQETTETKPTRRELFEQTVPAPGCNCSACMAYRRGTWRTK